MKRNEKVLSLLNEEAKENLKNKVMDFSTYATGGEVLHILFIADSQQVLDKFRSDCMEGLFKDGIVLGETPTPC